MKIFHIVNSHTLAVGIFLISLFFAPLAVAQSAENTLHLKGQTTARIVAHSTSSGVSVDVSIDGAGRCDINVTLSYPGKPIHQGRRICDTKLIIRDVEIEGAISIENYRSANGRKTFIVRVRGSLTDVAPRIFGGGYDRTYIDSDNKSAPFTL